MKFSDYEYITEDDLISIYGYYKNEKYKFPKVCVISSINNIIDDTWKFYGIRLKDLKEVYDIPVISILPKLEMNRNGANK